MIAKQPAIRPEKQTVTKVTYAKHVQPDNQSRSDDPINFDSDKYTLVIEGVDETGHTCQHTFMDSSHAFGGCLIESGDTIVKEYGDGEYTSTTVRDHLGNIKYRCVQHDPEIVERYISLHLE